ncbi:MAG TPA: hypothetical protein PL193_14635 [Xanthobacteraceae bacterium]|nr:hypothetical protein [Xanthobacteraceae bacterium]
MFLRFSRLIVCSAVAVLLATHSASADLKFSSSESNGKRFIIVSGDFGPKDDLKPFETLILQYQPKFITFNSEGGNPYKAMELGRLIRSLNIDTVQFRPLMCDSACALAFLGGVNRKASPGAIGVHMARIRKDGSRDPDLEGAALQYLNSAMLTYVREMGVSAELIEIALQYLADDMRHLSTSEMLRLSVIPGGSKQSEKTIRSPIPQPRSSPQPSLEHRADEFHDCDRLAANPNDPRKHKEAVGVEYESLIKHSEEAARQCEAAITRFPKELRFYYQKARAIELKDPKHAIEIYVQLIRQRYYTAYDNLGWMHLTGRADGQKNIVEATRLFRLGAKAGDADSMHSLGKTLWKENPEEALRWLERAKEKGHSEAAKDIDKLRTETRLRSIPLNRQQP